MMNKALCLVLVFAACGTEERAPVVTATPIVVPPTPILVAPTLAPTPIVIEPPPTAPKAPTQYSEAMDDAKAALAKGDSVHARELLASAVLLDKKQADPHVELARIAIAAKEKALAIKEAKLAVKLAPDSSRAWNTLGRAELARWQYQGAHDAFAKAAELDPDSAWAWNNLGFTELSFKSYRAAADALEVAVQKPGATGYMWNNLGTAYEQLDLIDEARDAFDHAGKLGSKEGVASHKRLEGVTPMIAKVPVEKPSTDYPVNEEPATDTATQ